MRKLIKDVMISFDKQQKDHQFSIIKIEKWLDSNEERLKEIEFLLYQSEDKQSRFDEIHDKITQIV